MQELHPTKVAAKRLGVSVWTVVRAAKEHGVFTSKFPTSTGGYLFTDADIAKLGELLNRPVNERAA